MLKVPDKLRFCNICGCTNEETRFYNGVTSRCTECHKKCVRKNRAENIEYYREYDAKRFQEQPERRAKNEEYNKSPRGRELKKGYTKKWLALNQVKRRAHIKVGNAVRDGKLEKATACQVCGATERRLHGHHHDYSKPLDVVWVCPPCHREFHK
jgi:hypothetical protein